MRPFIPSLLCAGWLSLGLASFAAAQEPGDPAIASPDSPAAMEVGEELEQEVEARVEPEVEVRALDAPLVYRPGVPPTEPEPPPSEPPPSEPRGGREGLALVIPGAVLTAGGGVMLLIAGMESWDAIEDGEPSQELVVAGSLAAAIGIPLLIAGLYWLLDRGEDGARAARDPVIRF